MTDLWKSMQASDSGTTDSSDDEERKSLKRGERVMRKEKHTRHKKHHKHKKSHSKRRERESSSRPGRELEAARVRIGHTLTLDESAVNKAFAFAAAKASLMPISTSAAGSPRLMSTPSSPLTPSLTPGPQHGFAGLSPSVKGMATAAPGSSHLQPDPRASPSYRPAATALPGYCFTGFPIQGPPRFDL